MVQLREKRKQTNGQAAETALPLQCMEKLVCTIVYTYRGQSAGGISVSLWRVVRIGVSSQIDCTIWCVVPTAVHPSRMC